MIDEYEQIRCDTCFIMYCDYGGAMPTSFELSTIQYRERTGKMFAHFIFG